MTPHPPPLREHQERGIEWLRSHPRALLADSPRSGKSAQLLLAAEGKTLIVAPPYLEGTWNEQFALWRPDLPATFCGYQSVARRAANDDGKMLLTVPLPRPELRGHWDTVICDESHILTNPNANYTRAVHQLDTDRLFLATGTPITHWAHELLVTLRLLYPKDRRFTNKLKWLDRWFKMGENYFSGSQEPIIKANDPNCGLRDEWTWADFWDQNGLDGEQGRMLQREIDLGVPLTEQQIEVEMTASQKKAYNELLEDYITWLPDGEEVGAWSDGGRHTKLMKCATGLGSLGATDAQAAGSAKLRLVREMLPEARRSPTLVFCAFRETAKRLYELSTRLRLSTGLIMGGVAMAERDRLRHQFQGGDLDVLIGTISTVALGLTLDRATTEIFVERSWTPWRNDQARKRALVIGKSAHVHIIDLYTKGTVDVGQRRMLKLKTKQQIAALTARDFRELIRG